VCVFHMECRTCHLCSNTRFPPPSQLQTLMSILPLCGDECDSSYEATSTQVRMEDVASTYGSCFRLGQNICGHVFNLVSAYAAISSFGSRRTRT